MSSTAPRLIYRFSSLWIYWSAASIDNLSHIVAVIPGQYHDSLRVIQHFFAASILILYKVSLPISGFY